MKDVIVGLARTVYFAVELTVLLPIETTTANLPVPGDEPVVQLILKGRFKQFIFEKRHVPRKSNRL